MDHILTALEINKSAIELVNAIRFTFKDATEQEMLVRCCRGLDGKEIYMYVDRSRLQTLKSRTYTQDQFVADFNINKKQALEQLFYQPLTDAKISKLMITDPVSIYEIHSNKPVGIRFMKFVRDL
ncbi:hypothetical protein ACH6EH_06970 [Paenibacillus sp. JSM ZJ436]|uniref:hypothetical protein n=1 Tax=Paenibacillus sp. JSM ZJ436 TaxID=3376190 RepID=UPI00378838F6